MRIRAISCTMASVAAFYGVSATAATVTPFSGDVFVNQGSGFHKINGAALVKVGDSVMVSPNGLAQVRLDDGSIISVVPGKVLSVPLKAQAKDGALPDGAGATAGYPVPPPPAAAAPAAAADNWSPVAAAALLAGGVAGAAGLANQSGAGGVAGGTGLASPPDPVPASPE
jgi:hypothetical protein